MPMPKAVRIKVGQASYPDGASPVGLPTFGGALWSAVLAGSDYWAGMTYTSTKDVSGANRDVAYDAAPGALFLTAPASSVVFPFTGDQLCAANNSCTLFMVARCAVDVVANVMGCYQSAAVRYVSVQLGSTYAVSATAKNDTNTTVSNGVDGDALRSGFEVIAATFAAGNVSVYRSKVGTPIRLERAATGGAVATVGGELPIRLGKAANGPAGAVDCAFGACLNRALVLSEIQQLSTAVIPILTAGGLVVAG